MKYSIVLLFSLLLAICACNTKDSQAYIPLPEKYYGFWVAEEYLESLKKTRSTRETQYLDKDRLVHIYGNQRSMYLSMHEGTSEDFILMKDEFNGFTMSPDSSAIIDTLTFQENYLVKGNQKYIYAIGEDDYEAVQHLVNETLITGEYLFEDGLIVMKRNGTVQGFDGISSYIINLDYYDVAMNEDIIYLISSESKERIPFIYEFQADTLILYEHLCKELDQGMCVVIKKGEIRYTLIKQK